ncbi:MAG: hypothetical protein EHM33_13420 [Chloroflexi bacterium]|jgi:hypothetical protein|nr:MAG: hypothetical protein EHM33_13420 [Chloroflexota bacterium]
MQNRTAAIIITVVTALVCICASIFACSSGIPIATGTPIDVTLNGETTQQTVSPTIGYVLLCLSLLMLLVPVAVGFFTLRRKPGANDVQSMNEPVPPAS